MICEVLQQVRVVVRDPLHPHPSARCNICQRHRIGFGHGAVACGDGVTVRVSLRVPEQFIDPVDHEI